MNPQETFFNSFGEALAQLAATLEAIAALYRVATARGYDQWSDEQLQDAGRSRNDLLALLYFADDLSRFLDGGEVAAQPRQATIDKFRTDL